MKQLVPLLERSTEKVRVPHRRKSINESVSRYCEIYKTRDGRWYMDVANDEHGDEDDATTYGPFWSEEKAEKFLDDELSNPGGFAVDDSGKRQVPRKSPNGTPIVKPGYSRHGMVFLTR